MMRWVEFELELGFRGSIRSSIYVFMVYGSGVRDYWL